MTFLVSVCLLLCFSFAMSEDACDLEEGRACVDDLSDIFQDSQDLFQTREQLQENCPNVLRSFECLRVFMGKCPGIMFGNVTFEEVMGKIYYMMDEICTEDSSMRSRYLQHSPCLMNHIDQLKNCTGRQISYEELFPSEELETSENHRTFGCMDQFLRQSCYLRVASKNCGIEAATLVRFALNAADDDIRACFS